MGDMTVDDEEVRCITFFTRTNPGGRPQLGIKCLKPPKMGSTEIFLDFRKIANRLKRYGLSCYSACLVFIVKMSVSNGRELGVCTWNCTHMSVYHNEKVKRHATNRTGSGMIVCKL